MPNYDTSLIRQRIENGVPYSDICAEFGCTKSTVAYHAGVINQQRQKQKRYNWGEVQAYHDLGHGYGACKEKFGFYHASWVKAQRRGDLVVKTFTKPIESMRHRGGIKKRLKQEGFPQVCGMCGIDTWLGKPLSLVLDHIDGNTFNNARDNLRLLCPNCNSQTDTFSGRNKKYKQRLGLA